MSVREPSWEDAKYIVAQQLGLLWGSQHHILSGHAPYHGIWLADKEAAFWSTSYYNTAHPTSYAHFTTSRSRSLTWNLVVVVPHHQVVLWGVAAAAAPRASRTGTAAQPEAAQSISFRSYPRGYHITGYNTPPRFRERRRNDTGTPIALLALNDTTNSYEEAQCGEGAYVFVWSACCTCSDSSARARITRELLRNRRYPLWTSICCTAYSREVRQPKSVEAHICVLLEVEENTWPTRSIKSWYLSASSRA